MYTVTIAVHNIHMNIRELLNENLIEIGAELSSKDEALERLIRLQKSSGAIHNMNALRREIQERECLGNSAVSARVAIPDVAHSGAARTAISVVTIKNGVEYGAPDKRPVKLIFMIAGKSGSDEHIQAKARLMHLLMDSEFTARLCAAENKEAFLNMIAEREKVRFSPPQPDKKYDCSKFLIKNKKEKRFSLFRKKRIVGRKNDR